MGCGSDRKSDGSSVSAEFNPQQQRAAAALFFDIREALLDNSENLLRNAIPVEPDVSESTRESEEIPAILLQFNYLSHRSAAAPRVSSALLECAGLLPRQRRVFVSYRRGDARQAALQLFDAFSSRLFDVFLDTHGIAPGEDFQAVLWHRLCDSDVLVMLDTPNYFESRWTSAEFGRALAKGISVLRIGWPDSTPSARTATASRVELLPEEIDPATGRLADDAIERICLQLESVRSGGLAVRHLNLVGNLRYAVEKIGGGVAGVRLNKAIYIRLADGRDVVAYASIGVPTSMTLQDATTKRRVVSGRCPVTLGEHPACPRASRLASSYVNSARWVKASEAAWQFADWGHGV